MEKLELNLFCLPKEEQNNNFYKPSLSLISMFVNIIKSYRDVVAICDKELLGKKFDEGKFQLDVKENFYKGEEKSEQEVEQIIRHMFQEDATFNIVGKKSIALALKLQIISQESIKEINNIPYSLVLV